jgi:asparagine synthase (glutamine-hydrolysing)
MPEPGHTKPVLTEAMRDVLPSEIVQRRHKNHFNDVSYMGISRNLRLLTALVDSFHDELEIFDKKQLVRALHEASIGAVGVRQLQRLDCSMALILWLSMRCTWEKLCDKTVKPLCRGEAAKISYAGGTGF